MASTTRWGDADDDSDEDEIPQEMPVSSNQKPATGGVTIPPTHYSRVDKQGIQIVTSYKPGRTPGQLLIKTVTKQRVDCFTVKEPRGVQQRRMWKKFGQALEDEKTNTKTTVQSKDEVLMENPHADTDLQDEDPAAAISGNLNDFWVRQQRRQLERKYGVEGGDGAGAAGAGEEAGGWNLVQGAAGTKAGVSGRYVPPGQRGAAGGGSGAYKPPGARGAVAGSGSAAGGGSTMDDLNTIRVTNLSENTTEADLQELFAHFGRVSRVYLAKNKETLESRGFAFVTFVSQKDAAAAMEKLQGFGYDHLILKLEWARPNTPKDPATSGSEYRSGYGKALAQDTQKKVSYASNLTK